MRVTANRRQPPDFVKRVFVRSARQEKSEAVELPDRNCAQLLKKTVQ